MAYRTHLYSPETYEGFTQSSRDIAGFAKDQAKTVEKLNKGDILICYLTKLSRWVGAHRIIDGLFEYNKSISATEVDKYVLRFHIEPIVWLPVEHAIPIHEKHVWDSLSFTRELPEGSTHWTGKVRRTLRELSDEDGAFLLGLLREQQKQPKLYPFDEERYKALIPSHIKTPDGTVSVVVPLDDDPSEGAPSQQSLETGEPRESHKIQGLLARVGEEMGFKVWLPKNDRGGAMKAWNPKPGSLLDRLPLNYDDVTLRTIEQIDVIWLKGRSIVRAFEVEHTTSVYSGILRMADLLALQPNMDIKLHIVAPSERREQVMTQISRPVFSLLERGKLRDYCTFISYDGLEELAKVPHLAYLSDSVLEEYVEEAD